MKLNSTYLTISIQVLSVITGSFANPWKAPSSTDLRSPCPGLNTLSNHGFLPRNGRNITVPMVLNAAFEGFNVDPASLTLAAKTGFLTSDDPLGFTLDDLKLHDTIEHDASLSRSDFALGDNLHFNATIFNDTLAASNPGVDYYNTTSAGQVMQARLIEDKEVNPNITNTGKEFTIRLRESALYLSVMGDPLTGIAPKKFVDILFREERLPIAEGWSKPSTTINRTTLNALAVQIQAVTNWTSDGGCESIVLSPEGVTVGAPDT